MQHHDLRSLFSLSLLLIFIATGTLTINGNPRLDNNGNISLSIRERDAPVSIAPGTKNLILNVALDREGKAGPSSVYVNVICVRRHTTDPVSCCCCFFYCVIITLQSKITAATITV